MPTSAPTPTSRRAAVLALIPAAARFPDLPPTTLDVADLSPQDAALALAIHRTTLQRWLTIEHLIDRFSNKPSAKLEPALRAVLLTGAAQLIFMPRLPAYAVVDESVSLARQLVRPGAAGLANAVLRKIGRVVKAADADQPWRPAADRLPLDGGSLLLQGPLLPDPEKFEAHLAAATSHPTRLIKRWLVAFSREQIIELCRHSVANPPITVAVESGFNAAGDAARYQPHEEPGFIVWRGSHVELVTFLAEHPARRVQDVAAAQPVRACRDLSAVSILDYCAGRGTKTRQLALQHPRATVLASDPNEQRQTNLAEVAQQFENVTVMSTQQVRQQKVDLLVLDVPCSNSGVLARRPEARYRLTPKTLSSVTALQRQIISEALPAAKPNGHILYSTCSIDQAENRAQAKWLVAQAGGKIVSEQLLLPTGEAATYRDGSYHALIRI